MEDLKLPDGYTYKLMNSENAASDVLILGIKEVNSVESAEYWFSKYHEATFWTWRVSETFPHSGRVNRFKKKYRCQYNVPSFPVDNPKRIVKSKNIKCPARLTITVKRFFKKSRSKNPVYQQNKDWPCIVEFQSCHNHEITYSIVLKYQQMKNKLQTDSVGVL